jgi:hypothetical protein
MSMRWVTSLMCGFTHRAQRCQRGWNRESGATAEDGPKWSKFKQSRRELPHNSDIFNALVYEIMLQNDQKKETSEAVHNSLFPEW